MVVTSNKQSYGQRFIWWSLVISSLMVNTNYKNVYSTIVIAKLTALMLTI